MSEDSDSIGLKLADRESSSKSFLTEQNQNEETLHVSEITLKDFETREDVVESNIGEGEVVADDGQEKETQHVSKITLKDFETREDVVESNIGEGEVVADDGGQEKVDQQAVNAEVEKEAVPQQKVDVEQDQQPTAGSGSMTGSESSKSSEKKHVKVSLSDSEDEEPVVDYIEPAEEQELNVSANEISELFMENVSKPKVDEIEVQQTEEEAARTANLSLPGMIALLDDKIADSKELLGRVSISEGAKSEATFVLEEPDEVTSRPSLKLQDSESSMFAKHFRKPLYSPNYSELTLSAFDATRRNVSLDMVTIAEENEEEKEEQHPAPEIKPEPEIPIDRSLYYDMYAMYQTKFQQEKLKNVYLQKRMVGYFTKRKLFHAMVEDTTKVSEIQTKYERDLEQLERFVEKIEREKESKLSEIDHLKNRRNAKRVSIAAEFERLQQAEMEYGNSLTFEKTGKSNVDKGIDRFLKRQKSQMNNVMKVRLAYLRLRDKVHDKTEELDKIDNLGPGFRIMDFVQLKHDYRSLHDRMEGKDTELAKLREDMGNTIQILAHTREKLVVVDADIERLSEDFTIVNQEYKDAREQLSYVKHERDLIRNDIKSLQVGLLDHPRLLRDMEKAIAETDQLEFDIEYLKGGCYTQSVKIEAIRKNMEMFIKKKTKDDIKKYREASRMLLLEYEDNTFSDLLLPIASKASLYQSPTASRQSIRKKSVSIRDRNLYN